MAGPAPAQFLPGYGSFQDYSQSLISALVAATKASNALPKGDDYNFHRTAPAFRKHMKNLGERLLAQVAGVLQRDTSTPRDLRDSSMDDHDRMALITDVCASAYERVDAALEAAAGRGQSETAPSVVMAATWANQGTSKRVRFMHAKNIRRPQEDFDTPVDNSPAPFLPLLRAKPFAKTELVVEPHVHPYRVEIESLTIPAEQLQRREPTQYQPLEGPCTWVDTVAALAALESVTEFAVDLEAHSYRSYQGFTCLMQLSTRTEDFLVDTLALRSSMHLLAPAFANPNILKVLHGADSDIVWLQRDFGIFVVNMFDTGQAMRILGYPRFSLAYLLSSHCSVTANKAFQLADWRIRPLSAEMLHYAREDTHYLLYVHDKLVNQLIDQGNEFNNLLHAVYERSRELCLQQYEKFVYSQQSADELFIKSNRSFNPLQLQVFYGLHEWRDALARAEDESIRFVLPDHMLIELADIVPREVTQILACCQPTPPMVKLHANNILEIINIAKSKAPKVIMPAVSCPGPPSLTVQIDVRHVSNNVHIDADNLDEEGESEIKPEMLFDAAAWIAQPPSSTVLFQSDDEDFDRSMRIRASMATAPLYGNAAKKEEVGFDRKGSNESNESNEGVAVEPTSFAEIYRLSNINRKKNKEKKKHHEEGAPEDGNESDEGEGEAAAHDPESFMQSIGWVSAADSNAFAAATANAAAAAAQGPYDFSGAPSLPGGGHMEPKASYAPHQDDTRHNVPRSAVHTKQGQRTITATFKK